MYTKSIEELQASRSERQMRLTEATSVPGLVLISLLIVVVLSFNGIYA